MNAFMIFRDGCENYYCAECNERLVAQDFSKLGHRARKFSPGQKMVEIKCPNAGKIFNRPIIKLEEAK